MKSQRPAWLPLYLVLVLGATLSPFWLHCAPRAFGWPGPVYRSDVTINALLLVPLGIALRRWRLLPALGVAGLLSIAIELAQRWLPRDPAALDVALNVAGAAAGWMASRSLQGSATGAKPAPRTLAFGCALLACIPLSLALRARTLASDFSNWTRDFPLILGNEASGSRPWRGNLEELGLYDHALSPADAFAGPADAGWSEGGPVLWLRTEPPRGARIDGPAGPRDLALEKFALPMELGDDVARHVRERLLATNELAIAARLRGSDGDPGPLPILSHSAGVRRRNFALLQRGEDLELRVRTPWNNREGSRHVARTFGGALSGGVHQVLAVYDGTRAAIFVDGICRGDANLALSRGPESITRLSVPTLMSAVALAGLAGALALAPRSTRMRVAGLWAAGGAAFALLRVAGTWDHLPHFEPVAWLATAATLAAAMPLVARRAPPSVARPALPTSADA